MTRFAEDGGCAKDCDGGGDDGTATAEAGVATVMVGEVWRLVFGVLFLAP